jgi:hypothetical protein
VRYTLIFDVPEGRDGPTIKRCVEAALEHHDVDLMVWHASPAAPTLRQLYDEFIMPQVAEVEITAP